MHNVLPSASPENDRRKTELKTQWLNTGKTQPHMFISRCPSGRNSTRKIWSYSTWLCTLVYLTAWGEEHVNRWHVSDTFSTGKTGGPLLFNQLNQTWPEHQAAVASKTWEVLASEARCRPGLCLCYVWMEGESQQKQKHQTWTGVSANGRVITSPSALSNTLCMLTWLSDLISSCWPPFCLSIGKPKTLLNYGEPEENYIVILYACWVLFNT